MATALTEIPIWAALHSLGVRREHATQNPMRALTRLLTKRRLLPLELVVDAPLDFVFQAKFPEARFPYRVTPGDVLGARLYWQGWHEWEPYVVPQVARFAKEAKRMLDVGAHTGVYSLYGLALNKSLEVYCFEPMPRSFARLTENLRISRAQDRCKPIQVAVSDERSVADFQITNDLTMCHLGEGRGPENGEAIRVPVERLDQLVPLDGKTTFVKMDVEGHEHRALRGMEGILEDSHPAILFECNPGAQGTEIEHFLRSHKYGLFSMVNGVLAEIEALRPELIPDGNHNFLALSR